jgi:PAS domain S-box-containing protein
VISAITAIILFAAGSYLQKTDQTPQIQIEYSNLMSNKKREINVLHIDDEPVLLGMSKEILGSAGDIHVDTALSIEEAFKKMCDQKYDVIVSDYELPKENGLQFLKKLRTQNNWIPFILFTGKCRDEIAIEALNVGADGYIDKNGNPETIYGELRYRIIQLTQQSKLINEHNQLINQYREFFSHLPSAVAVYKVIGNGEEFIFNDFNSAAEKIEKMPKETVLGKCVTEVFPSIKEFGLFEVFQRVWKTGKSEYFPMALYQDNRIKGIWRENWVIKLPNGNIAAIYNDITERKEMETACIQSQNKFESLFEANPDAAVFYDSNFRVIEANSRFIQLFGYTLDEILGKDILELIVPHDAHQESETMRQRIKSGLTEIITTRQRKDGVKIPLLVSGNPVFAEGKIIGTIFIFKEISDIITVQEELSNALSKTQQLNEKLKVVGSLTRHDVRNKLSVITGYSYLMKKKYSDNVDIINCLTKMEDSVKEAMKIFDFARTYEQIGAEDLIKINVEKAIIEAMALFSSLPFKVQNECHGLTVRADSLLRQLIYNFLDNSKKYGKQTTTVKLYYRKTAEGITLIYEDDGTGIALENKAFLFKQGFSTGGSTGFGLFLSRKILDFYGWTIAEVGEPGKGVKFVINIPNEK